jgi:hypothetical protein
MRLANFWSKVAKVVLFIPTAAFTLFIVILKGSGFLAGLV